MAMALLTVVATPLSSGAVLDVNVESNLAFRGLEECDSSERNFSIGLCKPIAIVLKAAARSCSMHSTSISILPCCNCQGCHHTNNIVGHSHAIQCKNLSRKRSDSAAAVIFIAD